METPKVPDNDPLRDARRQTFQGQIEQLNDAINQVWNGVVWSLGMDPDAVRAENQRARRRAHIRALIRLALLVGVVEVVMFVSGLFWSLPDGRTKTLVLFCVLIPLWVGLGLLLFRVWRDQ